MNPVQTSESSCGGDGAQPVARPAYLLAHSVVPGPVPEAASPGIPNIEAERLLAACRWTYECRFLYTTGSSFDLVLSSDAESESGAFAEFHVEEHLQKSPDELAPVDIDNPGEAAEESTTWTLTLRRTGGNVSLRSIAAIPEHNSAALPCEVICATDDELTVRYRRRTAAGDLGGLCIHVSSLNVLQYESVRAGVRMHAAPLVWFATPVVPLLERNDAIRLDRLSKPDGPIRSMEQSLLTLFGMLFENGADGRNFAGVAAGAEAAGGHRGRFQCDYRWELGSLPGGEPGAQTRTPIVLGDFDSTDAAALASQCAAAVAFWQLSHPTGSDAIFVCRLVIFNRTVGVQPLPLLQLNELLLPAGG